MFSPFLEAEGLTVKDFCNREVQPLDKEVEQVLYYTHTHTHT
jgi:hypothetical protein